MKVIADDLWQRGFGVVFPELEGESAFDDVGRVLDLIESLDARWAIPGHGAPFSDLAAALAFARERLNVFRADPQRHARLPQGVEAPRKVGAFGCGRV